MMARLFGRRPLGCCVLAGVVLAGGAVGAAPSPELSATTLYSTTVHGCQAVDLTTWQHPTRTVLQAAKVPLKKVQLCNDGRFPVFTVDLPYDVDGPNDRLLHKLYADLADANGFWSYALVDLPDAVVITVAADKPSRTLSPTYESFHD